MYIAIVGSRSFNDYSLMKSECSFIDENDTIVSGGAKGADSLAKRLSHNIGCKYLEYPAQWDLYGKSAGYRRNVDIIKRADVVLAFWDGKSKGTKHSIGLAEQHNRLLKVIEV